MGSEMCIRDRYNVSIEADIDINNKHVFLFDDIISTGGTICTAVDVLKKAGAKTITVGCVHPVFVGNAPEKIMKSGVSEIIASNTIDSDFGKVSVAELVVNYMR